MRHFEYGPDQRIVFGAGEARRIVELTPGWGDRVLVVTGKGSGRIQTVLDTIQSGFRGVARVEVSVEPTIALVREAAREAREQGVSLVIGIGGGSVIDAAKAIGAFATCAGDPLEYIEVIGGGKPLDREPLPCVAIPTTAGAGAEATRNAVLASPEHRVKASLRNSKIMPRLVIVDPEMTRRLPPELTASTSLDALTQLIEAFVSVKANALTDGFCRDGLRRAARSLRIAHRYARGLEEDDVGMQARADMALASLYSGVALAHAGLGAVHGFAAPIGGSFVAPHGAVCAALLPHVMRANIEALRERAPDDAALDRYREAGTILCGRLGVTALDGLRWVEETREILEIRGLDAFGIGESDVGDLVAKSRNASSMKGNPIVLTDVELAGILRSAMGIQPQTP